MIKDKFVHGETRFEYFPNFNFLDFKRFAKYCKNSTTTENTCYTVLCA